MSENQTERLDAAQLAEARVDHLSILEEEGGGALRVLDLQTTRLALHAKPANEVRQGLFVEVAGQDHELCALYVFHAKRLNRKGRSGASNLYQRPEFTIVTFSAASPPCPLSALGRQLPRARRVVDNTSALKYNP